MFSKEDGPGRIFKKARLATPPKSALREGIECMFCESVWWSAIITTCLCLGDLVIWQVAPLYWLAVSGGAIILNQGFTQDL